MAHSSQSKLVILLIALMAAAAPHVLSAITCTEVVSHLSPCLGYLQHGGALPPACCEATKSLTAAANTTPDRQAVCNCVKNLVPKVGAKAEYVNSIPTKCGVNIPYTYSPSLDCSKLH